MSINLEKRTKEVGIILEKRGVKSVPKTRVGLALDVSGSARSFYTNGTIQETIDRLLAVAMNFDDDGSLDAWSFDTKVGELPEITRLDEGTYVKDKLLKSNVSMWGGTNYAPPLKAAMSHYFSETSKGGLFGGLFKKSKDEINTPAMLLFITDGENSDRTETAKVLREAAKNSPVYFNMIGVGPSSYFDFIEEMADELPNVGFVSLSSLNISDKELYEAVVSEEFCEWVKSI